MKSESHNLLSDVFEDGSEGAFKDQVLEATLSCVRRRRATRIRTRRLGGVAAVLTLLAALLVDWNTPKVARMEPPVQFVVEPPTRPVVHVVASVPAAAITTTRDGIPTIRSGTSSVPVIASVPATLNLKWLSDEGLLAMFPGQPVLLVTVDAGRKEFLVLNEHPIGE